MARKCPSCDAESPMTRFEGEAFAIDHGGESQRLEGLSGWRCAACDQVEFDTESAERHAAARLTGGGHNAFSRYERGEAAPLPAVVNLFRPLDKHPEMLKDLV